MGVTVNGFHTDVDVNGFPVELLDEAIDLGDLHPAAAGKDTLPDAPDTTSMGLADAAGSVLISTATNNTAESETVMFDYALPVKWQVGAPISIIVRTRVTILRATAHTIDCVVTEWLPAGGLGGGDICTTAIQTMTAAYADYAFVVNPATLLPGDLLNIVLTFAANDGGGPSGAATIGCTQISVQTGVKQ